MTISEFLHFVEQWHVRVHGRPCPPASQGLVRFTTPRGIHCAARMVEGGDVELVGSPGHADESLLAAMADEAGDELHEEMRLGLLTPLADWYSRGREWSLAIRMSDGLAVLTCLAMPPSSEDEWGEGLESFESNYLNWEVLHA
jgi:hypothetical protein